MTIVGDGKQSRDMTFVGDVVNANIAAEQKLSGPDFMDLDGLTVNIGTGKNYTINELAGMVGGMMKEHKPTVQYVPERAGETKATLADISLARQILDWEPSVSLEQGIQVLKNYYSDRADQIRKGKRDL